MNNRPLLLAVAAIAVAFPLIAIASPVAIPNAFDDGDVISADEFNENFDAIAEAVNDNDARIAALEGSVGSAGVPTSTIAFFPVLDDTTVDGCPPGWHEYGDLSGRVPVGLAGGGTVEAVVGTALEPEQAIEISQVPSHVHSVDPPNVSVTGDGAHTHLVDPPSTSLTIVNDGDHTHVVDNGNGGVASTHLQAANAAGDAAVADASSPIDFAGDHDHGGSTVNVAPFQSQGQTAGHSHTVNIGAFSSAANTGAVDTVDVTMPYVQLLACVKE